MTEHKQHLQALFALLQLQKNAEDGFANTWPAAIRSFWLYALGIPFGLVSVYIEYSNIPQPVPGMFYVWQVVLAIPATLVSLWGVVVFSRWQNMGEGLPRFIVAQNWLGFFWTVFSFLLNLLTANMVFSLETVRVRGTILFFIAYAYSAFFTSRTLKADIFKAIGIATFLLIPLTLFSDALNLVYFGMARPVIGE